MSGSLGTGGLPQMPLASTPLTANQLQNIVNWVDDGAPKN
jgi:hypothetical protein